MVSLPASAVTALPRCRAAAGAVLSGWGLASISEDVQLVASELVANAIKHAPGSEAYELEFVRRGRGVRVAVADGSSLRPVVRELSSERLGGRGMVIVETLAAAWGWDERPGGKRVWADLDEPPTAPAQRS